MTHPALSRVKSPHVRVCIDTSSIRCFSPSEARPRILPAAERGDQFLRTGMQISTICFFSGCVQESFFCSSKLKPSAGR